MISLIGTYLIGLFTCNWLRCRYFIISCFLLLWLRILYSIRVKDKWVDGHRLDNYPLILIISSALGSLQKLRKLVLYLPFQFLYRRAPFLYQNYFTLALQFEMNHLHVQICHLNHKKGIPYSTARKVEANFSSGITKDVNYFDKLTISDTIILKTPKLLKSSLIN